MEDSGSKFRSAKIIKLQQVSLQLALLKENYFPYFLRFLLTVTFTFQLDTRKIQNLEKQKMYSYNKV